MREPARRDAWLAGVAHDASLKTARLMTVTELLVDDHQHDAALQAVDELFASGQRHIHALQWAMKANQQARNWPEVLRLVRILDKRNALHPALARRLREMAYEALLGGEDHDAESIRWTWATVPPQDRTVPYVAARAAGAFNARGLHDEARAIAEESLKANWDERVVRAYRDAASPAFSGNSAARMAAFSAWPKRPSNSALMASRKPLLPSRSRLRWR